MPRKKRISPHVYPARWYHHLQAFVAMVAAAWLLYAGDLVDAIRVRVPQAQPVVDEDVPF